jgi:hypothetical protein
MCSEKTAGAPAMHCLDCQQKLVGTEAGTCPECGREYDPGDFETFERGLVDPVRLCRSRTVADACLLRTELEAEGIHAKVQDAAAGVVHPGSAHVWVNTTDLESAKEVLRDYRVPAGTEYECSRCGKPMSYGHVWATVGSLLWLPTPPAESPEGDRGGVTVCTPAARAAHRCEACGIVAVEPPDDLYPDPDAPLACLSCGADIPVDVAKCGSCGWSYEDVEA